MKISFFNSLKGRILVNLIFPTITIISIIVFIGSLNSFSSARQQAELLLTQIVEHTALIIDKRNSEAIKTAKHIAWLQEEALFGSRDSTSLFIKRMLIESPDYIGTFVGYEPNADNQDTKYATDKYIGNIVNNNGRYLPYWYRDKTGGLVVEPMIDMEVSEYYGGIKKQFEDTKKSTAMITEPFLYEEKLLVGISSPIIAKGVFQGVAGVDQSLNDISTMLSKIKKSTGRDLYLLSRKGAFISATSDNSLTLKNVKTTQYADLFSLFIKNNQDTLLHLENDPNDKKPHYFVSATIPSGDWTLIIRESEDNVLQPIYQEVLETSVIAFIGLVMILLLSFWFINVIKERINNVMKKAQFVAKGNVIGIQKTNLKYQDEIGEMERSLDDVVDSYKDISIVCSAIAKGDFGLRMEKRSDTDLVADAINDMSNRRKEIEIELKERSDLIKSSTRTQSDEIDNVATSINEMSITINEVSNLAGDSANNATEAVTAAEDTQKILSEAVEEIKILSTEISYASEAISEVATSSENISSIVEVINMIAEQTNLLALNAAIEAARAGEQGRGFAVVADEVRSLASKTRISTKEISGLITKLQSEVDSAVNKVKGGVSKTQSTIDKSELAYASLTSITHKVDSISSHMNQVATAVEEQSVTCEEINKNIIVIHDSASELAALTVK